MDANVSSLYKILKDKTRQKIVLSLQERGSLAYVDLMNFLKITNTRKLKILGDLLDKDENGKYHLSEKGTLASQLLQQFPVEKTVVKKTATIRTIILTGFLGFILVIINPSILQGLLGVVVVKGAWLSILAILYGVLVPGAVMWAISVKRMHTHDLKELVKPPLFSIILLIVLVIVLAFLWLQYGLSLPMFRIGENASSSQGSSNGAETTIISQSVVMGQLMVLLLPLAGVYSYVGLFFSEGFYRIFRR